MKRSWPNSRYCSEICLELLRKFKKNLRMSGLPAEVHFSYNALKFATCEAKACVKFNIEKNLRKRVKSCGLD
jgi:hypothetical protein